jgi:hypothetical protein
MRRFITRLIFFPLPLIAIALSLQLILSAVTGDKSLNEIDNLEQTTGINADLLFLGSSRCWVQFDPAFFNSEFELKSINIGVDGHSELPLAVLRLKNYLSRNKSPKFIILSFDPMMNDGRNLNLVHKDYFSRYAFFPSEKNRGFVDFFQFNTAERYIPLYAVFRYQMLDDYVKSAPLKKYNPMANHLVDKEWDTIHNPIRSDMKRFYFTADKIPAIINALRELNQICIENKIKLLCLQTPVYKIIYDQEVFERTELICRRLKIPFVDMNRKYLRDDINNFYSPTHLNKKGVEKMNQLLKDDATLINFFKR